jgi:hypothetical protein
METKLLKVGDVIEVTHPEDGMVMARVHEAWETATAAQRHTPEDAYGVLLLATIGYVQTLSLVIPAIGEPRRLIGAFLRKDGLLQLCTLEEDLATIDRVELAEMRAAGCRN